jgi:hypothetical protein
VSAALADASARPVVADGQLDVTVAVADEYLRVLRAGVLDRVRQPFLDEPVGGEVDAGRQCLGLSLDAQLDRQAPLPRVSDELVEVLEARLRCERRRFLGPAQDADHLAHLGKSFAACLLDDHQRCSFLLLVRSQEAACRRRLHGHHADAVPDDVVELACDPRSLLRDREPGALNPLRADSALVGLFGFPVLPAEGEPDPPSDREEDAADDEVAGVAPRVVVRDDRGHADPEREAGDRLGAVANEAQ